MACTVGGLYQRLLFPSWPLPLLRRGMWPTNFPLLSPPYIGFAGDKGGGAKRKGKALLFALHWLGVFCSFLFLFSHIICQSLFVRMHGHWNLSVGIHQTLTTTLFLRSLVPIFIAS